MDIKVIGLDLAKNVFQVHGMNAAGKMLYNRQLKRREVLAFFATQPPCLVGLEACSGGHYWAREIVRAGGHRIKLMNPRYIKPFVRTNKSDRVDAQAIAEAAIRPTIPEVRVKSPEQLDMSDAGASRVGWAE